MELSQERRQIFQLIPDDKHKIEGPLVVKSRRVIVGSAESCDVVMNYPDVSGIHAVIEITKDGFKLYDMNSKNGSYINDNKVVVSSFNEGDTLKFSSHSFIFKKYVKNELPPVLDMIEPSLPPMMEMKVEIPEIKKAPQLPTGIEPNPVSKVKYPLAKDPKAEFSEYIFEDTEKLYPIFKYELDKQSVEVAILYNGRIFSVSYLGDSNKTYSLSGVEKKLDEVELPTLGKNDKILFLEIRGNEQFVHVPEGYESSLLSDRTNAEKNAKTYLLEDDDILILSKNNSQIFVRKSESPPKVASAPIFSKDKDLNKFLFLIYFLVFAFMGIVAIIDVDKEKEEEKAPERIATILHKPKPKKLVLTKSIAKTEDKPKEIIQKADVTPVKDKTPEKPVEKQTEKTPEKAPKVEAPKKVEKQAPVKKVAPNKGPTVKKPMAGPKNNDQIAKTPVKSVKPSPKKSVAPAKTQGMVQTYKSVDFKSTINNLLAKGGSASSVAKAAKDSGEIGVTGVATPGGGGALETAKASTEVGSLTGATVGRLDTATGVKGIVDKKTIYMAGIPDKTVVMGGMDPDVIRRILREHIPQFRYCYQKELDAANESFSGLIEMNFIIGSRGQVTKAGVESESVLPSGVQGCVVSVLKGISFPKPQGGGIVEVNQPFNFFPTRR